MIKELRLVTPKQYGAEENMRVVLKALRGERSIGVPDADLAARAEPAAVWLSSDRRRAAAVRRETSASSAALPVDQ